MGCYTGPLWPLLVVVCLCIRADARRSRIYKQKSADWSMDDDPSQRVDDLGPDVRSSPDSDGQPMTVDLRMPGIRAVQDDEYICNSWKIPDGDNYITAFEALASASVAHHIILYGCQVPGSFRVWRRCYSPCRMASDSSIMFAWARNAPPTRVPPDVGFQLGADSMVEYLVMQIHYKQAFTANQASDYSGLQLTITSQRPPYIAGVLIMVVNYLIIPAHAKKVHGDITCKFQDAVELHPFGFRVHAHELGRVVSGYVVTNGTSWQMIGKANPQWPQAFYPVANNVTIRHGDSLAARCTYNASTKAVNTKIGATHNDEMCNFYVMYYTDASAGGRSFYACSDVDQKELLQSMPADSDVELPPNSELEDDAENDHSHGHGGMAADNQNPTSGQSSSDYPLYNARGLSQANVERPMEYEYSNDPDLDTSVNELLSPGNSRDYVNELILQRSRNRHPAFPDDVSYPLVDGTGSRLIDDGGSEEAAQRPQSADGEQSRTLRSVDVSRDWSRQLLNGQVLGQVTGVATDSQGNVHLFHRASQKWTSASFDLSHRYTAAAAGPISENTLLEVDGDTGRVVLQWGGNMFYMPHGLHIDLGSNNVWVTDVAMHQVMRFKKAASEARPDLVLGIKFEPGSDDRHFCKPTAVATLNDGRFYVADGYCNSRVIQFSPEGRFIRQWGEHSRSILSSGYPTVSTFSVVHGLVAIDDLQLVCVADRENSRIQCFDLGGRFVRQIRAPQLTGRVFGLAFSPVTGMLYAINGPSAYNSVDNIRGYTINPSTGQVLDVWQPKDMSFQQPHDVTVSPDGRYVFVSETGPNTVWKLVFTNATASNQPTSTVPTSSVPVTSSSSSLLPSSILQSQQQQQHPQTLRQALAVDVTSDSRHDPASGDLGPSLFIGALLFIPVTVIVCITMCLRLRKSGRLRRLFARSRVRRGVEKVRAKDLNRDELERLQPGSINSDSDIDEYSAVHQRA